MTRPTLSALVLDGETIKLRLQAERASSKGLVHVDWLRFTVARRDAPFDLDVLFPQPLEGNYWDLKEAANARQLAAIQHEEDFSSAGQALTLAREVCEVLGPEFSVSSEPGKGHDFYARRWIILFNDAECGWVGYGASSSSPKQRKQAQTVHCNLYGTACTFAVPGWLDVMASKLDQWEATITRCDLALDFFEGMPGGLDQIVEDYKAGSFDCYGKRPMPNQQGDWINGVARSFYVGSRENGKQTNIYEKGHQLFGADGGSSWLRWELRYGNKMRVLPSDMLRNPDPFFAGGSAAHEAALALAEADLEQKTQAQAIPCKTQLANLTVEAEVSRNLRFLDAVAAPSLAAAWQYLGDEGFLELVSNRALPRRLQKFSGQLKAAYERASQRVFGHASCPDAALAFS